MVGPRPEQPHYVDGARREAALLRPAPPRAPGPHRLGPGEVRLRRQRDATRSRSSSTSSGTSATRACAPTPGSSAARSAPCSAARAAGGERRSRSSPSSSRLATRPPTSTAASRRSRPRTIPLDRLEVIVVDGGSTDGTGDDRRADALGRHGFASTAGPRQRRRHHARATSTSGSAAAPGRVAVPRRRPHPDRAALRAHLRRASSRDRPRSPWSAGRRSPWPATPTPRRVGHRPGAQQPVVDGRLARTGRRRQRADRHRLPGGLPHRATCAPIGGWDERLPTNQDFELNRRMAPHGVVWFDASLRSGYLPRAVARGAVAAVPAVRRVEGPLLAAHRAAAPSGGSGPSSCCPASSCWWGWPRCGAARRLSCPSRPWAEPARSSWTPRAAPDARLARRPALGQRRHRRGVPGLVVRGHARGRRSLVVTTSEDSAPRADGIQLEEPVGPGRRVGALLVSRSAEQAVLGIGSILLARAVGLEAFVPISVLLIVTSMSLTLSDYGLGADALRLEEGRLASLGELRRVRACNAVIAAIGGGDRRRGRAATWGWWWASAACCGPPRRRASSGGRPPSAVAGSPPSSGRSWSGRPCWRWASVPRWWWSSRRSGSSVWRSWRSRSWRSGSSGAGASSSARSTRCGTPASSGGPRSWPMPSPTWTT